MTTEQPIKILITGAFNTGKSTFIRSLSDITVVDTDRRTSTPAEQNIKDSTTVAMDYGRIQVGADRVQLFGTPGQTRFDFMIDVLAKDMDGFLVLVDAADAATIDEAAALVEHLNSGQRAPYAVVANKSDLVDASSATLRQRLRLPADVPIYACVATDGRSVRSVIRQFLSDALISSR